MPTKIAYAEAANRKPALYVARIVPPGAKGARAKAYMPMAVPKLHRLFLKEVRTPADVLPFANRYGNLHPGEPTVTAAVYDSLLESTTAANDPLVPLDPVNGEPFDISPRADCVPLADWLLFRAELKEALALWHPSPQRLRRLQDDYGAGREEEYKAQGRYRHFDFHDFRAVLLDTHVGAMLPLAAEIEVRLDSAKRQVLITPLSLRAALWGHLALEICRADRPTRVCEHCGRLTPGRSDKRFCNDACRKAHSRARGSQP